MPKPRNKERVVGQYFVWLLGKRGTVYVADGRSNKPPLGRHSLGTKDYHEALEAIQRLDLTMAVEVGLVDRSVLDERSSDSLDLQTGREFYVEHVKRPKVTGGAKTGTHKRYRAVFDKFIRFAKSQGVTFWEQVNRRVLESYASWLEEREYAYATQYLELTTLKQTVKWLIENDHLATTCRFQLPMHKPQGTDTYCWKPREVRAIVRYCSEHSKLEWLANVVTALASTGLRISELAALRWSDIDFRMKTISLTDESTRARRRSRRKAREIKNRRGRSFPIHDDLLSTLQAVPRHDDGLVFHGPRGGTLKPDTVRRILIRDVLTKLAKQFPSPKGEIGFVDGRLHSFRHYFCSTCANAGVSEQVLMSWLGHQNSRMVQHYYHLHNEEAQRQMKRLNFVGKPGGKRSAG